MYLGRQRRDRAVALVLAAVLVGGAVLGLLVTLAARGAGTPASGTPYAAAPSPTSAPAPATAAVPLTGADHAADGHEHTAGVPADGVGVGHPWRLVGTLVGVALLFGCGVLVVHEQRRRAGGPSPDERPGGWIS